MLEWLSGRTLPIGGCFFAAEKSLMPMLCSIDNFILFAKISNTCLIKMSCKGENIKDVVKSDLRLP